LTIVIRELRVPLNASETLRLTLETTRSAGPVVRVGLCVRGRGGPERPTPVFTLAITEVRRVAAQLAAFADQLEREATTHVGGKR